MVPWMTADAPSVSTPLTRMWRDPYENLLISVSDQS
jgi:hypothetical protein